MFIYWLFTALIIAEIICIVKKDEDFAGGMMFARPIAVFIIALLSDITFGYALLYAVLFGFVGFVISMVVLEYAENHTSTSQPSKSQSKSGLNIDNDYFLIKDGRLLEWRGSSDFIVVPDGVHIIGGDDKPICKKTIQSIFIPQTVHVISDLALPQVESVHCEGPQEYLYYDKEYNFYADGWTADWSKDDRLPYHVYKVSFHFNDKFYRTVVDDYFKKHPEVLRPRSSCKN